MSENDFDLLFTNGKNLYYQQKISSLKICILNINSNTNRFDDVLEKMTSIYNQSQVIDEHVKKNQGGYFTA